MVGIRQLHFSANALFFVFLFFFKSLWEALAQEIAAFKPAVAHSFQ